MSERATLLQQLDETVTRFVDCLRALREVPMPVYPAWNASDILAHLTFWHESFARNVEDLAHGRSPAPLKGRLRDLNTSGVEAMRGLALEQVIQRMETAQGILRQHILNPRLVAIPYRKGSRDYTAEEHLEIVQKHIQAHLSDIQKAHSKKENLCPS